MPIPTKGGRNYRMPSKVTISRPRDRTSQMFVSEMVVSVGNVGNVIYAS